MLKRVVSAGPLMVGVVVFYLCNEIPFICVKKNTQKTMLKHLIESFSKCHTQNPHVSSELTFCLGAHLGRPHPGSFTKVDRKTLQQHELRNTKQ